MEPSNAYKRQHYVPQFYLRKFASNESCSKIWAHRKAENENKEEKIKEMGQEYFFYQLETQVIEEYNKVALTKVDKNIIEKEMMGAIDNLSVNFLDPFLLEIEEKGLDKFLSPVEKYSLGFIMSYQYLRTKKSREAIAQLNNIPEDKRSVQKDTIIHISTMLSEDQKIIRQAANHFWDMDWVIFINETSIPLITSDHPIVQSSDISIDFYYYPLSSKVLIALFDKKYREKHKSELIENKASKITSEEVVRYCNDLQYNQCVVRVFSNIELKDNIITRV